MPSTNLSTHENLIESLRVAHAADLTAATAKIRQLQELHNSDRALWEEKLRQALDKIVWLRRLCDDAITAKNELLATVRSQQETIKSAMSDLVILKGAGRVRHVTPEEQASTPGINEHLGPDVSVVDDQSRDDIAARRKLIRDAEDAYAMAIEGLDVSKVTPEAVAAAIPASQEDWNREHAQPETDLPTPIPRELV